MRLTKLWNGPSPAGEQADRGNDLDTGLPYRTHSGPGFRASVRGEFREVTTEHEEKTLTEDSWISASSPFVDQDVHFVSAADPRRRWRRRVTASSSTAGWARAAIHVVPDSKGAGYFLTADPLTPPITYLHTQKLSRFGRSVKHQYAIAAYVSSLEYFLGYTVPIFRQHPAHLSVDFHARSMNWWYADGPVFRNEIKLEANLKVDGVWYDYPIPPPPLRSGRDIGMFGLCFLSPTKMAAFGAEHPLDPATVYHCDPLQGSWTKMPGDLTAAFPGEVPFNASYYTTEAAWAAANDPLATPQSARTGFLSQQTIRHRIVARGSGTHMLPIDSAHGLYVTAPYPTAEAGATWRMAVSVVNVNTGAVSNVWYKQFTLGEGGYLQVTPLGKDSWIIEVVRDDIVTPSGYPTVVESFVTFTRGASYAPFALPAGYVAQTLSAVTPIERVVSGVPGPFEVVGQVDEDGRRIYKSKDLVEWGKGGVLAKPELIDYYDDFLWITKLGTRADPGRINHVAPWSCDTRVSPPDWW